MQEEHNLFNMKMSDPHVIYVDLENYTRRATVQKIHIHHKPFPKDTFILSCDLTTEVKVYCQDSGGQKPNEIWKSSSSERKPS